MEINNIDDLVKLAGLVKSQEIATEAEVEEDCGCQDAPAEITASPDMYAILSRLAKMGEVHEDEIVDEWANTPAETGEPEARVMDQPKGEPVDTSLRRYLGANGQPVKVEEAIQDHTVEEMMEAYNAFKTDAIEENSEEVAEEVVMEAHCDECDCDPCECDDKVTEAAVDEAEVEEDNAFNTAAANAKKAGKSEFEFNGKKYKVKMDAKTADALTDDVEMLRKLAGL
jgi:hypothetical protein